MELKIDRGIKSYDIVDADGQTVGTIRFNPSDPGFVARWDTLVQELNSFRTDISLAETLTLDAAIKEKFDYAFGSPVSGVLFGGLSCLALCEDGRLVFEHVLDALRPLIEESLTAAAKAAQERLQQHTEAYQDPTAGLAPGQQA